MCVKKFHQKIPPSNNNLENCMIIDKSNADIKQFPNIEVNKIKSKMINFYIVK